MARRARGLPSSFAGKGAIPEAPTDTLAQPQKPLGPVRGVGKRGFKTSKHKKYSKRGM